MLIGYRPCGLLRNGETLTTADGVVCFATVEAAEQAKQALNLEESKGTSTEVQAFRCLMPWLQESSHECTRQKLQDEQH